MANKHTHKRKVDVSHYILPAIFVGMFVILSLIRGWDNPPVAQALETKPLKLSRVAIENYAYGAGFLLDGDTVTDKDMEPIGTLTWDDESLSGFTLTCALPPFTETKLDDPFTNTYRNQYRQSYEKAEAFFLSVFDVLTVTDDSMGSHRVSVKNKLETALPAKGTAEHTAHSWHFAFSLEKEPDAHTLIIRGEKLK